MKLIIDISDNTYKDIMARDWKNAGWLFSEEWKAIHNGKPLDNELQEIRQEISEKAYSFQCLKRINDEMVECEEKEVDLEDVLKIIDTHISALNNDQFERIWQNTVEEMRRRKICEDILEEAEEWDSETMSGSLLTDDDLRLLINDAIKEKKAEQDKVTQLIKDNADFIKEMARMLEEADNAESEDKE